MGEMKRLWAAVGILAALLAGFVAGYVVEFLKKIWQERSFWLHALLRHSDTDQVLLLFRSVEEYLKLEEMDQYAAANAQLIAQLELLAEMEDPSLENVL